MHCKYCGEQLDAKAAFCPNCGKSVNGITPVKITALSKVLSILLILFSFYGFFADAVAVTDEGELNPLGFIILLLLAGCVIALYKTRVYFINIICIGALSVIYLIRIFAVKFGFEETFGLDRVFDFDAFKTVYWVFFITLSILTVILVKKYHLAEQIKSWKNHFKCARIITLDEMNSIVLSALHEKRQRLFLIIGLVCCSFSILTNIYPIKVYTILLIPYIGIAAFLYVLQSNIGKTQPVTRLYKDFDIAIYTFVAQACANIIYMITLRFWNNFDGYNMLLLLIVVVNIVLSFCFYKISCGFKGKQNTSQLEISIWCSMIFLCTNLVLVAFKYYYTYRLNNGMYFYSNLFDLFWIRTFISDLPSNFVITKAAEFIASIVIVIFLRSMLRNLNVLTNTTDESEGKPLDM